MRKRDRESYDAERGNGTESRCCVADVEQLRRLKGKTYEDKNGDQWTEGPVEEQDGSKTRKVKQEDASKYRNGPVLQECVTSGMNVDGSGYRSGEARNSSMEKYGPPSGERRM